MYFGANTPSSYVVKVSRYSYNFNLGAKNYVNIVNVDMEGSNLHSISGTGDAINIGGCSILKSGQHAIELPNILTSTVISNCTITDAANMAVHTSGLGIQVLNNTISNTGVIRGAGADVQQANRGIAISGPLNVVRNNVIQGNSVVNTGYCGISIGGGGTTVANNYVDTFCTILNDCGGIYYYNVTVPSVPAIYTTYITDNIFMNGVGDYSGSPATTHLANGIYIDDGANNVVISGNTSYNNSYGIFFHDSYNAEIFNNISYNNRIQFEVDSHGTYANVTNLNIHDNTFIALSTQYIYEIYSVADTRATFGTIDHNFYASPTYSTNAVYKADFQGVFAGTYTPAQWQVKMTSDYNSKFSIPITESSSTDPSTYFNFQYNSTSAVLNITLSQRYLDTKGNYYPAGVLKLAPYSAVLLMPVGDIKYTGELTLP
jgi:parallel beta-helix repeat protein